MYQSRYWQHKENNKGIQRLPWGQELVKKQLKTRMAERRGGNQLGPIAVQLQSETEAEAEPDLVPPDIQDIEFHRNGVWVRHRHDLSGAALFVSTMIVSLSSRKRMTSD